MMGLVPLEEKETRVSSLSLSLHHVRVEQTAGHLKARERFSHQSPNLPALIWTPSLQNCEK